MAQQKNIAKATKNPLARVIATGTKKFNNSGGHHCPTCYQAATKRCEKKGHILRCSAHVNHFYKPGGECISCQNQHYRDAKQEREERLKEKKEEKEEKEAKAANQKTRKRAKWDADETQKTL